MEEKSIWEIGSQNRKTISNFPEFALHLLHKFKKFEEIKGCELALGIGLGDWKRWHFYQHKIRHIYKYPKYPLNGQNFAKQ